MGKVKSLAAKRRQRRRQKLAKITKAKGNQKLRSVGEKTSPSCEIAADGEDIVHQVSDSDIMKEHTPDPVASPFRVSDDTESSSFGSPGSPPSSPFSILEEIKKHFGDSCSSSEGGSIGVDADILDDNYYRESVDGRDQDLIEELKTYPLQYQCETFIRLFLSRTQTLHRCRERIDSLQLKINDMSKESERKVQSIREFWRDAVYSERTRSGTILKNALLSSK